jgi:hypothetical protein
MTINVDTSGAQVPKTASAVTDGRIDVWINGAGSAITTGQKKVYVEYPFAGTITAARLIADQSGDVVVDIWKKTFASLPTVADTITASAKPTLSSAQTDEDTTLTGWTTAITAKDIFDFNIDSAATITKLHIILEIEKTV